MLRLGQRRQIKRIGANSFTGAVFKFADNAGDHSTLRHFVNPRSIAVWEIADGRGVIIRDRPYLSQAIYKKC